MTTPGPRDLTFHQLRMLLKIAEAGSFSRAAVMTGVTQSALSRLSAQMEEILGARLFERSGRGLTLTESGRRLHQAGAEILRLHDATRDEIQELRGVLRGECRVAMPESVGRILFLPLIRRMRALHPDCSIRVMEAFSANIPAMMQAGQVDVAVVTNTHSHGGLNVTPFADEALYLVGRHGEAAVREPEIRLRDVAGLPLLLTALSGGIRGLIDGAFAKHGLTPNVRLEVDSNEALLDLVRAGDGFAIMTFGAVHREVVDGDFGASLIVQPSIRRRLYHAIPANRPMPPVSREVARQLTALASELCDQALWSVVPEGGE